MLIPFSFRFSSVKISIQILMTRANEWTLHPHLIQNRIGFPPEVHEIKRATRLPNSRPFQQISVLNNVYKYSFYPRTIVTWNNLPISDDVNRNNFKRVALAAIKSFE